VKCSFYCVWSRFSDVGFRFEGLTGSVGMRVSKGFDVGLKAWMRLGSGIGGFGVYGLGYRERWSVASLRCRHLVSVAVRCSVAALLQCVAVLQLCCSALQCRHLVSVAVRCSALQCVAVCCSVLQCVAVCCSVLQCDAVCCVVLQCLAVCYSVSQSVAAYCSILQCVAVCCSVVRYGQVWCSV